MHDSLPIAVPSFLKPNGNAPLVRLGRIHDGGYLVDMRSLDKAKFLLTGGINDDWSFEVDWLVEAHSPVWAYDLTVSAGWFILKIFSQPRRKTIWIAQLWQYLLFFRSFGKATHIRRYLGHGARETHTNLISAVSKATKNSDDSFFLKLDIEGDEYALLPDILILAPRLSGLIIEFHDVNAHLVELEAFAAKLKLDICHLHINNCAWPPTGRFADVVEVTFTPFSLSKSDQVILPHPLDSPNEPTRAELVPVFC